MNLSFARLAAKQCGQACLTALRWGKPNIMELRDLLVRVRERSYPLRDLFAPLRKALSGLRERLTPLRVEFTVTGEKSLLLFGTNSRHLLFHPFVELV